MSTDTPVPIAVTQAVDEYADSELHQAREFTNRSPLDDSGVGSLHRLAARIYAEGFSAGAAVEAERGRRSAQRAFDRAREAK